MNQINHTLSISKGQRTMLGQLKSPSIAQQDPCLGGIIIDDVNAG